MPASNFTFTQAPFPVSTQNNAAAAVRPTQPSLAIKGHDPSLDALRIVAMLMVILIHTSGKGFPNLSDHWWAVNTYESLSRACVPIFFMITGALLLPRSHTVKNVLQRSWRIAFVLVAWSVIFLLYGRYKAASLPDLAMLRAWVGEILRGPVMGHLWYLYSLIAAYFFIPVLAGFFKTTEVRLQALVLCVWFIGGSLLPFLNRTHGDLKLGIDIQFFYIYPAYILAGALLYKHFHMNLNRFVVCSMVWVIATAGTAYFTWHHSVKAQAGIESYYEYFAPLVVIATLALFCAVRYIGAWIADRSAQAGKVMMFLGGLTFGVYLIHPMIILEFEGHGYGWNYTNPWLAIPSVMFGVAVVSGLITYVIKKVPYLRALIPG